MSMSGVSITSSKGLQFESTQEAYNRAIIKLNLLLLEGTTHEEAVRTKLFEVMREKNTLSKYSASELYVMQKSIETTVDDFLVELNEQYVSD